MWGSGPGERPGCSTRWAPVSAWVRSSGSGQASRRARGRSDARAPVRLQVRGAHDPRTGRRRSGVGGGRGVRERLDHGVVDDGVLGHRRSLLGQLRQCLVVHTREVQLVDRDLARAWSGGGRLPVGGHDRAAHHQESDDEQSGGCSEHGASPLMTTATHSSRHSTTQDSPDRGAHSQTRHSRPRSAGILAGARHGAHRPSTRSRRTDG